MNRREFMRIPGGVPAARRKARIDKTVANAIRNGISEHYDSISGRKLGVDFLGMTRTVVTMMLDGLCSEHELELKSSA